MSQDASPSHTERATLGGGCFWCLEAIFQLIPGVRSVVSGYAGGQTPDPSYEQVCTGQTGHAEVVQIEFDPSQIPFSGLLDLFWEAHDPTTLNRQGPDSGTQYRSVIFFENDRQRLEAEESKHRAAAACTDPIVTEIAPLDRFYPAESYHHNYYRSHPSAPYCAGVIAPKLSKFRRKLE